MFARTVLSCFVVFLIDIWPILSIKIVNLFHFFRNSYRHFNEVPR